MIEEAYFVLYLSPKVFEEVLLPVAANPVLEPAPPNLRFGFMSELVRCER